MTTDLLKLSKEVTKDTTDKLIEKRIRENLGEIRKALREGRDYEVENNRGSKIVIRAKKTA